MNLSKTVSHALRHEPWLYELELDDEGWVSVDLLLVALRRQSPSWRSLSSEDLVHMVESSTKKRHEILGTRIRALYGHSVPHKLKRTEAIPPQELFHGTSPDAVESIMSRGLESMGRQYVHLSTNIETALAVGRRKAEEPRVLMVRARDAHQEGVSFYEGNSFVWLADFIPSSYVSTLNERGAS